MRVQGVLGVCVLAGGLGVLAALALSAGPAVGSPGTTTAPLTSTRSSTTTTTPRSVAPPPTAPILVAEGVTVGGVDVGGFARTDAKQLVETHFEEPLQVVLGGETLFVRPAALGATARITAAVDYALIASAGEAVPLVVTVNRAATARFVRKLAKRFDRKRVDSRLRLQSLRPVLTKGRAGRLLRQRSATQALVDALLANRRTPVTLPVRTLEPKAPPEAAGPVVVIRRGERTLWLYRGTRLWRTFRVAVGQPAWPTPLGRFEVITKWRNPWWFPPASSWARGAAPLPPGPGNPLGTRWMGISSPGVGIHGTFNAASIGGYASHGCIRMYLHEAEWLFDRVAVGTPVFIVAA